MLGKVGKKNRVSYIGFILAPGLIYLGWGGEEGDVPYVEGKAAVPSACSELFHSMGRKENSWCHGRAVGWALPGDGSAPSLLHLRTAV